MNNYEEKKTYEERKAYREGYLAGEQSVRFTKNYTEEELKEIEAQIRSFCDSWINNYNNEIKDIYHSLNWLNLIPGTQKIIEKKSYEVELLRNFINFMAYAQSIVIPQYLDFLNSNKNVKFYTNFDLKEGEKQ